MIEETKKPSSKELGALRVEAIKKLRTRGYTIGNTVSMRSVAEAIADHMRWTPRSDYEAVIRRFLEHEHGETPGQPINVYTRKIYRAEEMQAAYSRCQTPSQITLESKGGK